MPWLVVGSRRIPLEIADTPAGRARGLLGRDGIDGALLLRPARAVHTVGMRFAIDVAHVDREGSVLSTTTMGPNRLGRRVRGTRSIVEAEAGRFSQWGITPGLTIALDGDQAAT